MKNGPGKTDSGKIYSNLNKSAHEQFRAVLVAFWHFANITEFYRFFLRPSFRNISNGKFHWKFTIKSYHIIKILWLFWGVSKIEHKLGITHMQSRKCSNQNWILIYC